METEKEKSAGAIIFRKEDKIKKFLLLHYSEGHWDFPKGHVEKNETELETAKREIEEETGLKELTFLPKFRETISYYYKRDGKLYRKEVVFFLAEASESAIKISKEHIGSEWLEFNKAMEKLTFKNAKELLKKANDFPERETIIQGKLK